MDWAAESNITTCRLFVRSPERRDRATIAFRRSFWESLRVRNSKCGRCRIQRVRQMEGCTDDHHEETSLSTHDASRNGRNSRPAFARVDVTGTDASLADRSRTVDAIASLLHRDGSWLCGQQYIRS